MTNDTQNQEYVLDGSLQPFAPSPDDSGVDPRKEYDSSHDHDGIKSKRISASSIEALGSGRAIASATYTGDVTISGLKGDTVLYYELAIRSRNVSATYDTALRFNGDTGTNYRRFRHVGVTSPFAISADSNTGESSVRLHTQSANHHTAFIRIWCKSGTIRTLDWTFNGYNDTSNFESTFGTGHWTNTADELTSITVYHLGGTNPTEGFIRVYARY